MRKNWLATVFLSLGAITASDLGAQDQKQKGFLGIAVEQAAGDRGIIVREVTADSPAAKAGLIAGDRILKLGDKDADDIKRFLQTVATTKPGEKVTMRVDRSGKEQDIQVTLGEWTLDKRFAPDTPFDWAKRIRDLERRVEELEKRLKDRDKK
jgi:serine protease Do